MTFILVKGSLKEMLDRAKDIDPSEMKPYPNEHSCRLTDPSKYVRIRRVNNAAKVNGKRIDFIFGVKKGGGSELQAIRYPKEVWTASQARAHCNTKKHIMFEAAG